MPSVTWSQLCVQVTDAVALCTGMVLREGLNNSGLNPPFVPFPIPLQLHRELLCFPWEMLPSLRSVTAWRDLWGRRGTPGPSGVTASGGCSTITWHGYEGVWFSGRQGMGESFAILCSPIGVLDFAPPLVLIHIQPLQLQFWPLL